MHLFAHFVCQRKYACRFEAPIKKAGRNLNHVHQRVAQGFQCFFRRIDGYADMFKQTCRALLCQRCSGVGISSGAAALPTGI